MKHKLRIIKRLYVICNICNTVTLSAAAMRSVSVICDDFAKEFHATFSASKPKCLIFFYEISDVFLSYAGARFYGNNMVMEKLRI